MSTCIYCDGLLDEREEPIVTGVSGGSDDAHASCVEEEQKTTPAPELACPKCGRKEVASRRGGFVEVGPWNGNCYLDEHDVTEYVCQVDGCNTEFYI